MSTTPTTRDLWRHIFGDGEGYVCVASGKRQEGRRDLDGFTERYYPYPASEVFAAGWPANESKLGRDTYFCAHLLTDKQRRKERAAKIRALYFEMDGGDLPANLPRPTALVRSSPGHFHGYLRLTRPVSPAVGEELNRRYAHAAGADSSGYDLTQLLRPVDTVNHKYPDKPLVVVEYIDDDRAYDPDELDSILPQAPLRRGASIAGDSLDWTGEEPPVRLGDEALAWWTGARQASKPGTEEPSRARSLWAIGKELAKANASTALIAGALANRDEALGYRKYSGRSDAGTRYATIAARAVAEVEQEVVASASDTEDGKRTAKLEMQVRRLNEELAAVAVLMANENIGPGERIFLWKLANHYKSEVSAGRLDAMGRAKLVLGETTRKLRIEVEKKQGPAAAEAVKGYGFAYSTGIDSRTLGRYLDKAAMPTSEHPDAWGILDKVTIVGGKNPDGTPKSEIHVRMSAQEVPDILVPLLDFAPLKPRNQGGRRTIDVPPAVAAQADPVRRERKKETRWHSALTNVVIATQEEVATPDFWTAQGEELAPEEVAQIRRDLNAAPASVDTYPPELIEAKPGKPIAPQKDDEDRDDWDPYECNHPGCTRHPLPEKRYCDWHDPQRLARYAQRNGTGPTVAVGEPEPPFEAVPLRTTIPPEASATVVQPGTASDTVTVTFAESQPADWSDVPLAEHTGPGATCHACTAPMYARAGKPLLCRHCNEARTVANLIGGYADAAGGG